MKSISSRWPAELSLTLSSPPQLFLTPRSKNRPPKEAKSLKAKKAYLGIEIKAKVYLLLSPMISPSERANKKTSKFCLENV